LFRVGGEEWLGPYTRLFRIYRVYAPHATLLPIRIEEDRDEKRGKESLDGRRGMRVYPIASCRM
jgi:hypothetical protein